MGDNKNSGRRQFLFVENTVHPENPKQILTNFWCFEDEVGFSNSVENAVHQTNPKSASSQSFSAAFLTIISSHKLKLSGDKILDFEHPQLFVLTRKSTDFGRIFPGARWARIRSRELRPEKGRLPCWRERKDLTLRTYGLLDV